MTDIIVDSKLRPWLLEVNFCPALSHDCDVDVLVKVPMLNDLISLINLGSADVRDAQEHATSGTRRYATSKDKRVAERPRLARVGQFVNVFPFNERTREAAKQVVIGSV